jgi:acetoin utilization deacetylase AcuC-like enzyme
LIEGTKGSWNAAIAAVAASVQAVDMIMNGECVNVFCLTRPPGHHAGRELHAMKAVSNGFCLLNSAACAALYATAPVSEGGPGLRRVCVIDIDVHHGNGTQDILCSTYDPRFLYVSIHAGGPDVNGVDPSVGEADEFSHHLARTPKKGIFPGRCGDFSPHQGVLNIPLGTRVTSHALGAALMTKVTPAVEKFSPELIIISTGFDAHKNDPLGLGGLSAEDFGTLTEVICKLAHKSCSGRVVSILEGGYGVPCCRLPTNLFDPEEAKGKSADQSSDNQDGLQSQPNGQGNAASNANQGLDATPSSVSIENPSAELTKTADNELPNPPQNAGSMPTPDEGVGTMSKDVTPEASAEPVAEKLDPPLKPLEILDLGDELPENMKDDMPYLLMKRLDKCHSEGFIDCVREHVATLAKCNLRN